MCCCAGCPISDSYISGDNDLGGRALSDYRDYVYIRTNPPLPGGKSVDPRRLKASDLAVTRAHLKAVRASGYPIHRRNAVTERVGAAVAASGRPKFMQLLRKLDHHATLIVCTLDGLGRDAADILATIRQVEARGAEVCCLAISDEELSGCKDFMPALEGLALLSAQVDVERGRAKDRGFGVAGGRIGRPRSLDDAARAAILVGLEAGETVSVLARRHNTSRQTILRVRDAGR